MPQPASFLRRPQRVFFRRALLQIHLWAGIVLSIYVALIGVTGSILVFRSELTRWLHLKPWQDVATVDRPADAGAVIRNVRAAYPGRHIVSLTAPEPSQPVFVVLVEGRGAVRVACHPLDGRLLGEFPRQPTWLDSIDDLHANLWAHRSGRVVNGAAAGGLLLMAATGIVLWWRGIRKWTLGLTVDLRRGWRRINFDLHSAAGFWTLLIISFWAVSGIYFAWPRQVFLAVNSVSRIVSARPPAIIVPAQDTENLPDVRELVDRAERIDPGTRFAGIDFPYSSRAPLGVLLERGNGIGREYVDTVFFDPYSGAYLTTWRYGVNQTLGDWVIWLMVPLHFGTYWGLTFKLLWAMVGLALPTLAATGLIMYWNRVLRRKWRQMVNLAQGGSRLAR